MHQGRVAFAFLQSITKRERERGKEGKREREKEEEGDNCLGSKKRMDMLLLSR